MDIKITLDISARFEHALNNLADAMAHHPFAGYCDFDDKRAGEPHPTFAELMRGVYPPRTPAEAPEPAPEPEAPDTPPAPELATTAPAEAQEVTVQGRIVENPEPEPMAVSPAAVEPVVAEPVEKPKKKKAAKKATEAPEPAPAAEAPITQPEPEPDPAASTAPQETTPKPEGGDPMGGMTVVEAMQALVSEIQQKGVDMAAVNGRVRAKANELGLAYSSAACLIKAIGYVETRKVALGEK